MWCGKISISLWRVRLHCLVIGHARVEIDGELAYIPGWDGVWVCGGLGCASVRVVSNDRGMVGRGGDPLPHPWVESALAACEEEEAET